VLASHDEKLIRFMLSMSELAFDALNLNLLPALAALLEERSVSVAARRAGVSQSAMSHSLARLRELLDDPLLIPSGRRMVPTPRGEAIALELPTALEQLELALRPSPTFDPRAAKVQFSLATHDYFELTALPDVLGYLNEHAPQVDLEVLRLGPDTHSKMTRGEIDLALSGTSTSLSTTGLAHHNLLEMPFSVIARAGHPRIGRRLSLKRYVELSHVLVAIDGRSDGVVDRALEKLGYERRVALRVPHFISAPIAVATSDLICTVASSVAERGRELFGLRVFRPPLALPSPSVSLLWPRQHEEDPAKTWFRELFLRGTVFPPSLRKQLRKQAHQMNS
jgi:DNA-binding transcriptional LysR family regulator